MAPSTVSQHLQILREAGLVQGEVDGPRTSYCISRDRLGRVMELLQALAATAPALDRPAPSHAPHCHARWIS